MELSFFLLRTAVAWRRLPPTGHSQKDTELELSGLVSGGSAGVTPAHSECVSCRAVDF